MASSVYGDDVSSLGNFTTCDREPIHHIEAIQAFGFLIAVNAEWSVCRVSSNIGVYLRSNTGLRLGMPLSNVVTAGAVHVIRNRAALLNGIDAVERVFAIQLEDHGPCYDLAVHRSGELIIIEAEPSIEAGDLNAGAMVRSMLAHMQGRKSLVREAARLIRAFTGFDRVMIYRFHPDGSGEVIAEKVRADFEPFLGLRYPAKDIPKQARALLIRNPVRILADVGGEPSRLLPHASITDTPLDLSMSTLRAHSAMHIEYLQNMGVAATMTVSLVRDNTLWGLISCHHGSPRKIGFEQRTTVELFGQVLSLLIEKQERADVAAYEAHTRKMRDEITASIVQRGAARHTMTDLAGRLADLVPCDGFAVYADGIVTRTGTTPTADECKALHEFLSDLPANQIYATDGLSLSYAPAQAFRDRAAGLLAMPISRSRRDYLVFFRKELAQTITWAGRLDDTLVPGPDGPRLSPRKSFEAWREIVGGRTAPWTKAELVAADAMRITLLEMALELAGLTEIDTRVATQKQEMLIAELNHRVRNILGLIRGLIGQSRRSARDVDTFATILGDRVHALARAHDQITEKNWGPGALEALISNEAAAFLGDGARRVKIIGPDMLLQPQAFSTIALVVHELMTNAAKYGALSDASGHVAIDWFVNETGDLTIDWLETGGPLVSTPTRRGFGSTIIQRSVPHELGGSATLNYRGSGLEARFVVPTRHVVHTPNAPQRALPMINAPSTARLSGAVLLVEDNIIIAMGTEELLMTLGADNVLVAGSVATALQLLETETPTFALLDINLGAEMSWPVATRLRELGVPYVFGTGYGDGIDYPLEHRSTASLTKPYSLGSLAAVI